MSLKRLFTLVLITTVILLSDFNFFDIVYSQSGVSAITFGYPLNNPTVFANYNIKNSSLGYKASCYPNSPDWRTLNHTGIDLHKPAGTEVRPIANGVVVYKHDGDYPGSAVTIKHTLPEGDVVYSVYGHLVKSASGSLPPVTVGQSVTTATVIGTLLYQKTSSGSDNSHLHFEIRTFEDGSFLCNDGNKVGPGYAPPNMSADFPILGDDYTGFIDPYRFIANMNLTNQIKLFPKTFFRGNELIVLGVAGSVFNLPFGPNLFGSIALPDGSDAPLPGSALVFKAADGQGPWKYYEFSNVDVRNDRLSDGSQVLNNIASVKNGLGVCLQLPSGVNAAASNGCVPTLTPTPNPGGSTPPPPMPSGSDWQASYYDGDTCWNDTNCPIQPRCTSTLSGPELHAGFGTGAPCNGMSGDNWVGDFRTTLNFSPGSYVFRLDNDDGAKVWLNGQNIQDRGDNSTDPICPAVNLNGNTSLRVLLREDGGDARAHLTWTSDTSICNGGTPPSARWQVKYYNYDKNNPGNRSQCTPNAGEAGFDGTYLFKDWRTRSPGGNCQEDFIAEITGKMYFEANKQYTFHLNADDAAWLEVYGHKRGNLVIDRDSDDRASPTGMTSPVETIEFWDAGERDIRLIFRDNSGDAIVQAWWEGSGLPVLPNDTLDPQQWFAEYWGNRHLWQDSVARRNEGIASTINYNWGDKGPGFGISADEFSARFRRTMLFQCGNYRFNFVHDDGIRFDINGTRKLDKWSDATKASSVDIFLSQGSYPLTIEHYENQGSAQLDFSYQLLNTTGCFVDLRVSSPSGWSAPVILSAQLGTQTNDPLYVGEPVYIDIGYENIGTTESGAHFVDLYIDGQLYKREWISHVDSNSLKTLLDLPLIYNSSGTHTVGLVLDPENAVSEGNENNNTWSSQFTWQLRSTSTPIPTTSLPTPTLVPTFTPTPAALNPNYGNGTDGDINVANGQTVVINAVRSRIVTAAEAGANSVTIENVTSFAVGQEVLVIAMRLFNAGYYDLNKIIAITGNTLTLEKSLRYRYAVGSEGQSQVILIPQYRNVTVQTGGILTAPAWDGTVGGVLIFRANGITSIDGSLNMHGGNGLNQLGDQQGGASGGGYRGGNNSNDGSAAYSGEGAFGGLAETIERNHNAGGGAGGTAYGLNDGAGGANGGNGENGSNGAQGGYAFGSDMNRQIFMGGGGGGGRNDTGTGAGGGGAGGGIIMIFSSNLNTTGSLNTDGGNGGDGGSDGGGGAGGSILIKTSGANLGSQRVTAYGGTGPGGAGNGGHGRIWIEWGVVCSCVTYPPAESVQVAELAIPPTPTYTPFPATATSTNTPIPPTATFTRISPTATNTVVPATATRTAIPSSPTWTATPIPTFTPVPQGFDGIFADSFESGNLTAWSASATDSGDLTVSAAAALIGNQGLQAVIDDATSIYVTDERPNAESRYRARFYFDPNTIKMAKGNAHFILYGYQGTSTVIFRVEFRFSSGNYQLNAALINDSTSWKSSSWYTISDAPHSIELDWQAATAAKAKNGKLTLWLDGVSKVSLTGIDNDTRRVDRVQVGALAGMDSGTRGSYFFDAFESRRVTYIGAVGSAAGAVEVPAEVIIDEQTTVVEEIALDDVNENQSEMVDEVIEENGETIQHVFLPLVTQ